MIDDREIDARFEALLAALEENPIRDLDAYLPDEPEPRSRILGRLDRLVRMGLVERPLPPLIAGRYRILGVLGHGGMGTVLRALDAELDREVAIKVIHARRSDPGSRATDTGGLLEEARVAAGLEHPGIVPVYDEGALEDGSRYFTMRLVRGQSLAGIIEELHRGKPEVVERFGIARRVEIVRRVCDALAFAHARGSLHRDLKPANIMIGEFGEVQVVDWGLARAKEGQSRGAASSPHVTLSGRVMGTPSYMAPEQARGETVDERADVFGVGGILKHLLSGRPPFWDEDSAKVIGRAAAGRLNDPSLEDAPWPVAPELGAVVRRALAVAPSERYASVAELSEDLSAFLERRVVRAYRTGALATLESWARRHVGALCAAGAVVLAGLLATVAILQGQRQAALERVLLTDGYLLDAIEDEARGLAGSDPDEAPRIRQWLELVDDVARRAPVHRDRLALAGSESADLPRLRRVVETLDRILGPGGARERMRVALASAESVRWRTVEGPEARARWREAVASISDPRRCPAYGGMTLEPQLGLLPLRQDPRTGLWEFLHWRSGEPPGVDDAGRLVVGEASGIVMVLLPAGDFLFGAQRTDPEAPGYDPAAGPDERISRRHVEPFFIGKYEVTQGQWLRLVGSNPSMLAAGEVTSGMQVDLRHPVDSVDLDAAEMFAGLCGLALPDEVQWEYAARGGTTTRWSTGDDPGSLQGYANLADQAWSRDGGDSRTDLAPWDDGFAHHAPVGSFLANPYGLHDVHGNVWEWVHPVDWRTNEDWPPDRLGQVRGGSCHNAAVYLRSANRSWGATRQANVRTGLRVLRELD